MSKDERIKEAREVLELLGLPKAQINRRSALCLLALLNLIPDKSWSMSENPLMGITPIMDWSKDNYSVEYAPNTRETFRRQSIHQFVQAGIALQNPDDPKRAINSPKTVYQIEANLLAVLKSYGTKSWKSKLANYLSLRKTLIEKYAKERDQELIPVEIKKGKQINLSSGKHSKLIKAIIEGFAPRFLAGAKLVYVGDTGEKFAYFDEELAAKLEFDLDRHGKMPDVVFYDDEKGWLILAEAVTSHGPMDNKRYSELSALFTSSNAGLVYVTAFPDKTTLSKYLGEIAWETEVWVADSPTHLIHFDGERFLGPYPFQ
jgi:hypothetical protein